jgi:hypothetical protein
VNKSFCLKTINSDTPGPYRLPFTLRVIFKHLISTIIKIKAYDFKEAKGYNLFEAKDLLDKEDPTTLEELPRQTRGSRTSFCSN